MTDRICPVCGNLAFPRLQKKNIQYYQCCNCRMLYCDPLDQDNMVGGGNEIPRNEQQNQTRIGRIDTLFKDGCKPEINVLDFGCGHGMLVKDLKLDGYNAVGYDAYSEEFNRLPPKDYFNAIVCVEVIEHTSFPFPEIEVMYRSLKHGGAIYFETSFVDVADQECIELEDFFYIDPSVGHSTIFSHHALDLLMVCRGFKVGRHFNRHARLYFKA